MAALFGKKEEKKTSVDETATEKVVASPEKVASPKKSAVPTTSVGSREDIARVLTSPRITEKATLHTDKGVYVFDVAPDANKKQIKEAIFAAYKVHPVKVSVTNIASKKVRNARTGMKGVKSGGKKAYVYLKKGDTISIM